MGWFEDLGNAVSSGVAVVADVVETVVETVTDTAENAVDAGADVMEDSVDYVVDWLNINGGAIVGGIANVVGGIVNGALDAVQQIVGGILHIVKDAADIVGSLLRLDLPGLIDAVLHLLIDVGILVLDALRTVLLGFFIGHIVENFDRNGLRQFVNRLLRDNFAEPRRTQVRNALRMSDPLWGLRPHVTHKTAKRRTETMSAAFWYSAPRREGKSVRVWPCATSIPAISQKWSWRTRWDIILASVISTTTACRTSCSRTPPTTASGTGGCSAIT
jgi:hypothetical protein